MRTATNPKARKWRPSFFLYTAIFHDVIRDCPLYHLPRDNMRPSNDANSNKPCKKHPLQELLLCLSYPEAKEAFNNLRVLGAYRDTNILILQTSPIQSEHGRRLKWNLSLSPSTMQDPRQYQPQHLRLTPLVNR